jgi:hypothetical protein
MNTRYAVEATTNDGREGLRYEYRNGKVIETVWSISDKCHESGPRSSDYTGECDWKTAFEEIEMAAADGYKVRLVEVTWK